MVNMRYFKRHAEWKMNLNIHWESSKRFFCWLQNRFFESLNTNSQLLALTLKTLCSKETRCVLYETRFKHFALSVSACCWVNNSITIKQFIFISNTFNETVSNLMKHSFQLLWRIMKWSWNCSSAKLLNYNIKQINRSVLLPRNVSVNFFFVTVSEL